MGAIYPSCRYDSYTGELRTGLCQRGDEKPIDYRFMSANPDATSDPHLIYMDEPIQKLTWGNQTYVLADIYKRWGFPQDTMPWSLDTIALYHVRVGEHSYIGADQIKIVGTRCNHRFGMKFWVSVNS